MRTVAALAAILSTAIMGCATTIKPDQDLARRLRERVHDKTLDEYPAHNGSGKASLQARTAIEPPTRREPSIVRVGASSVEVSVLPVPDAVRSPFSAERLRIPDTVPGAEAAPLRLPAYDEQRPAERLEAIDALFPRQPTPSQPVPGDASQPALGLADFERIALANNPSVAQADAEIEAATGAAIQAGAYPNPVVGYEADTVGSGGTRNYQGMFITQEIKTAGKLELARAIANVDLMNRQLDLRRTRAELLQKVRAGYLALLVARENLHITSALLDYTTEVFDIQVEQLKAGQAAAYEPMQLRALMTQARGAQTQACNRFISAWKQLAAALGDPAMPMPSLAGRGTEVRPPVNYEASLALVLSDHTAVLTARNLEFQKRLAVRLAEVTPIPDVQVYSAIQKDFTTPPVTRTTYNLQVGVPVPVFNRNRGGIQKARGELVNAAEEVRRVRLDLSARLADAFERYESNRALAHYYREQILPDQARVFRGVYERHQNESDQVGFGDVIVAQQNLIASVASYVNALTAHNQAYAELTGLLQLEDAQQLPLAAEEAPRPVPGDPPSAQ